MNDTQTGAGSGISIGTITALVFVVLKLCHVIDWSWWWVLSPLWIPVVFLVALLVVGFPIVLAVKAVRR